MPTCPVHFVDHKHLSMPRGCYPLFFLIRVEIPFPSKLKKNRLRITYRRRPRGRCSSARNLARERASRCLAEVDAGQSRLRLGSFSPAPYIYLVPRRASDGKISANDLTHTSARCKTYLQFATSFVLYGSSECGLEPACRGTLRRRCRRPSARRGRWSGSDGRSRTRSRSRARVPTEARWWCRRTCYWRGAGRRSRCAPGRAGRSRAGTCDACATPSCA
jgi:hypothetical protein